MRRTSGARSTTRVWTSPSLNALYISGSCARQLESAAVNGALHKMVESAAFLSRGGPVRDVCRMIDEAVRRAGARCDSHDRGITARAFGNGGVVRHRAHELNRRIQVLCGHLRHVLVDE